MTDDLAPPVEQTAQHLVRTVKDLFAVYAVTLGTEDNRGAIRLRGRLLVPAERAYPEIQRRLRPLGYTPLLTSNAALDVEELTILPGTMPEEGGSRLWVHALLFGATILTTLYVGAGMSELRPQDDLWWPLFNFWHGWPFSLSLMSILLTHEMGHYLVTRYHGLAASLPYFIPLPLPDFLGNVLGTIGAVIVSRSRMTNRRVMFDIGAAGPVAGLAVAIPVLLIGLSLSTVQPLPGDRIYLMEGNSLLYLLLKYALFGQWLPAGGIDVTIHPVAFAGWAGILVTSLNLIPAGQLDGGHVLYSLLGKKAERLTLPIILVLGLLGLVLWPGWLMWAGLVYLFGRGHPAPLDEVTRLGAGRRVLALSVLLLFVLTFTPIPLTIVTPEGFEVGRMVPGAPWTVLTLALLLASIRLVGRRLMTRS
ncbi:MAG: site-2 protease family protein [Anaerolineae bacterium]|nr:site-2 protease family protein [Anaerolineae bacterium]